MIRRRFPWFLTAAMLVTGAAGMGLFGAAFAQHQVSRWLSGYGFALTAFAFTFALIYPTNWGRVEVSQTHQGGERS